MKSKTAFLILCCALGLSGCRKDVPVSDSPSGLPRLISLAPNLTEMIWAVGAGPQQAGRTSACDQPPEARAVSVVGGYGDPSIERLLALQPARVLYIDMLDKDFPARLREHGVEARHIPCLRLDDIPGALEAVGRLAGRQEQASAAAESLRAEIRAARATDIGKPRPSVLALLWTDPLYTVGKGSFVSDLIDLAGGRNIGDEVDSPYFQASPEWILERNPDVILCLFEGKKKDCLDRIAGLSAFASVSAVRNGRLYSEFRLDELLRPGPRVMRGVSALRQCLLESNPTETP